MNSIFHANNDYCVQNMYIQTFILFVNDNKRYFIDIENNQLKVNIKTKDSSEEKLKNYEKFIK